MTTHAVLSPSGFKAIMLCPAKPAMERGLPDKSSKDADEGTLAHELAAAILNGETCPEVTDEMYEHVLKYTAAVRDYQGPDGTVYVEQAVPIGHITGEAGAVGTADAVILRGRELVVVDLKYGKGVEVFAEDNPQLMLYALGALEKFSVLDGYDDFDTVRMVIVQPRVKSGPDEFVMSVADLVKWAEDVAKPAAQQASYLLGYLGGIDDGAKAKYCNPHPDACRWCRAKSTCPALAASVQQAIGAEFTDLTTADKVEQEQIIKDVVAVPDDQLAAKMDAVELVEMWCKAIRARVESVLLAGGAVEGYKLVQGRKGARAWTDPTVAEAAMKSMRLKKDVMYDFTLISPASAEKLLKATPRKWSNLAKLITQSEGKPSVAPLSDKRPALEVKPMASEFEVIGAVEDLI